jgi:hypothetical protein
MRAVWALAISVTLAVSGCGVSAPPAQQTVTLPSGKQVKVLGVGKVMFSNDAPALMLKYETDIPIDDKERLSQEADEIWKSFRDDVEKAQLTSAILSANEPSKGLVVTTSRGFNFVYKRGADGTWSRLGSS